MHVAALITSSERADLSPSSGQALRVDATLPLKCTLMRWEGCGAANPQESATPNGSLRALCSTTGIDQPNKLTTPAIDCAVVPAPRLTCCKSCESVE